MNFTNYHSLLQKKYQEILQRQTQTQSKVDQCQAYYEAVGGVKKRRIYGLGSQAQLYYGPNLRPSFGSDATSSVPPLNAQPATRGNLDDMIPALTDRMLPVFVEWVRGLISSSSSQPDTPTDHPLSMAPIVPALATDKLMRFMHRFLMMTMALQSLI
ncbi:uncharacterized protein LOC132054150 [Lycium ferocissimum]|uniref:uncharacterized protein LOC132054150 n=1 Tax=Lycium ferocissimum TaxID=112874 RepID=UPI002815D8FA|nr:uncharacterized protein LOC132054150 [Lycium ferocissimum]